MELIKVPTFFLFKDFSHFKKFFQTNILFKKSLQKFLSNTFSVQRSFSFQSIHPSLFSTWLLLIAFLFPNLLINSPLNYPTTKRSSLFFLLLSQNSNLYIHYFPNFLIPPSLEYGYSRSLNLLVARREVGKNLEIFGLHFMKINLLIVS